MTDQPTAETGAEAVSSIEDTLSKTFDEIAARPEDGAEAEDTSVTETEESPTAEPETATDEVADTTDPDSKKDEGAAEQPLSPSERWSAERKAEFASLPRKAQEILLQREAETNSYLTQESQKIADLKRNYEPLDRIIGPRREAWALSGFTTDTALEHLFALSDFATRDKPGFIRWFAQQHGVDIGELSSGADAPDPKLTALEQRIASFEQTEQQRQQQAAQQSKQEVVSAIEQFAADTKAHPHYKDVENDVALLLPGIKQQNPGASHKELLQIAYDKAIRVNDAVSAKITAEQKRVEDLKAADAAKKAKAAAGANVRTSGSLPDGRRKLTMDETMSETFDRVTARA